jgi:hypothetical protein
MFWHIPTTHKFIVRWNLADCLEIKRTKNLTAGVLEADYKENGRDMYWLNSLFQVGCTGRGRVIVKWTQSAGRHSGRMARFVCDATATLND